MTRSKGNGSLADLAGDTLTDSEQIAVKLVRDYLRLTPTSGSRDACKVLGIEFSIYMAARRKQGWREAKYDPDDVATTGEAFRFGREEAKKLEAGNALHTAKLGDVEMDVKPKSEPEIRGKRHYTKRLEKTPAPASEVRDSCSLVSTSAAVRDPREQVELRIAGVTLEGSARDIASVLRAMTDQK